MAYTTPTDPTSGSVITSAHEINQDADIVTEEAQIGADSIIPTATVTASGTLVGSVHNPVDATAGVLTMTLPTPSQNGQLLSAEKYDATTNIINITGSIRGSSMTINLSLQHETVLFSAGSGSWWPIAGHKTISTLDARYFGPDTVVHGGTPTAAAGGAAAGTSPPAPIVVAGSTDRRGTISFGTGSGNPHTGSAIVNVTFATAYAVAPQVMLTPCNTASGIVPVLENVSTTGFGIGFANAPGVSQANTVYVVAYSVIP